MEDERRRKPLLSDEIEDCERKIAQAVKGIAIAWPAVILLDLYLKFFPDLSTAMTYIAGFVVIVSFLVAIGAIYQSYENWRNRRDLTAMVRNRG